MKLPIIEKLFSTNSVKKLFFEIEQLQNKGARVYCSQIPWSVKNLLTTKIQSKYKTVILLQPDIKSVEESVVELKLIAPTTKIIPLTDFTKEAIQEKLTAITNNDSFILVVTYKFLQLKLPNKDQIKKNTSKVEIGGDLNYEELIEFLSLLGYKNNKFTESPGEFSMRGSIIDFWSFSEANPVRLEFDGDFLESIRYFDPESQRSIATVESVTVAGEILNDNSEKYSHLFDFIESPFVIASNFELNKCCNFTSDKITEFIEETEEYLDEELKKELYENAEATEKTEQGNEKIYDLFNLNLDDLLKKNAQWLIENELKTLDNTKLVNIKEAPVINSNFELLFNLLIEYTQKDYSIIITTENELQGKRLLDLLSDHNFKLAELIENKSIRVNILPIKSGFLIEEDKLLVLTDYQIFNKPYRSKLSSNKLKKSRVKDFSSIKKGDYVVHENFGIGRYEGLETIKIGMVEQESIKIVYAENGLVYVNLNYLGLVKKFSSKDKAPPKLTTLGSNEWKNTKKKVKAKIKDAARELIQLYAKRKSSKGYRFSEDTIWQKELEASFFYEDTPDQSKVTEEVKSDMQEDNPMDRLVCGDVGFGKTEIAVRAAFKAVQDNKQAAVLVPTTILAEQHFNTFKDRLSQFPVKVAALSRFQTAKEQKEIVQKISSGEIDIVIGTHRLVSKDVSFKDLGLLIIDEEQRFGVMVKEKLRQIKADVDTLTLTATPIPRTLNLSLLGARDLSIIATPPPNRQPIYTKVDVFDIHKVRKWILDEIKRNGQVYFVHDRIMSIDKIAAYISKYIPEINIAIAHGQMKPNQLEKVIHDFMNKKYHLLLSTKIIESGIDIPNVNTIIVNRADRFGLAELHQLRGRVGRSDKQAYAYFLVPSLNSITKKAVRRLQAIEEFTDLGEGFSLSMRDLEIRGAGNLLGTEQSGSIDQVGFDLYVKLLDEAVEELKQKEFRDVFSDLPEHIERTEPTIDTYFEIGIPKEYMPDQSDRLGFYTALFSLSKIDEVNEIQEEMIDRFGKIPVIVDRLVQTAILRFYASFALFERIILQRERITLMLPKGDKEDFYVNKFSGLLQFVVDNYPNTVQFKQENDNMKLIMKNNTDSPEKALQILTDFCKKIVRETFTLSTEV